MTTNSATKLTRGKFVQDAMMLPALAGLLAAASIAPAEAASGSKTQFKYQSTPNNGKKCSKCTFFIPGKTASASGTCKVVSGSISPNGWCTAFSAKS